MSFSAIRFAGRTIPRLRRLFGVKAFSKSISALDPDFEVVDSVVQVGDDLLDLCSAFGGDLGDNLAHYAASAEFNAVIFVFHADYISRR